MPASSTQPRTIVYWNSQLKTATRHVRGHEPYCACGWVGHLWRTHAEAQLERSFHVCVIDRAG